jgi:tetratricopeptide (TPR) repeat protein
LLSRFLLVAALVLAHTAPAAPETGELDASPALFTVLAALNASGFDAELNSPNNHPLRMAVRNQLAQKNLPSIQALRTFFENHRQTTPTAELSQYISYALVVDGPPNFEYRVRAVEIPPDVVPLEGLSTLLARFYAEAGIEQLWTQSQPAFEEAIARYHEPVSNAVLQANAYLRNPTAGYLGRRFQIYIDLLAPPNQIHARSYGTDYFVVVSASAEPQTNDIRHGYLHYLLDPLATKYAQEIGKKRGLADHAQRAQALEPVYKEDFLLLLTESLIKAVEARLDPKPQLAREALEDGYVLTPFFSDHLPVYEKQPQAMRLYFPEMIEAIDLKKEDEMLAKVQFSETPRVRHAKLPPRAAEVELTGVQKTIQEAEALYGSRDLDRAKEKFLLVLRETSDSPLHARAYYGLARIAVLQRNPEVGDQMFRKALESSPEPYVKAWVLVYLGRLADAAGERAEAVKYYEEALKVEKASLAARRAAENEIKQGLTK